MARSRNLKPSFFANEELGRLPALTRLLYAGLWTLADHEGRLEDRPDRIRVQVLPYDEADVDLLLHSLYANKFIRRYVVDGRPYIDIPTFLAHQNPHKKERDKPSLIPAFDEKYAIPGLDPENPGAGRFLPDPAVPLPSSLFPRTSSLVQRGSQLSPELLELVGPTTDVHEQVLQIWNKFAEKYKLSGIIKLSDKRRRAINSRLDEKEFDLLAILKGIAESSFLRGGNKQGWAVDFDFIFTSANNYLKILEGKYKTSGDGRGPKHKFDADKYRNPAERSH